MKKFSFIILTLLILLGCNSKPSFDTSLLIGKWVTTETDSEDGIDITTVLYFEFINEKKVNLEVQITCDVDFLGRILCAGEYKINGSKIVFNFPESNAEISLNRDFYDSSYEYNQDLKEFKKEINDLFGESETNVVSITADELITEEEGDQIIYNKFSSSPNIYKESADLPTNEIAHTKNIKIPDSAIRGDFDGDGSIEYVWVDGERDEEDYPINGLMLKSDNPMLNGLKLDGFYVTLVNLRDVARADRDFLGVINMGQSGCFGGYEVYGFKGNKWIKPIDPFEIYTCNEKDVRVLKTDRKGYVQIIYEDLDDEDYDFELKYKEVKFNF